MFLLPHGRQLKADKDLAEALDTFQHLVDGTVDDWDAVMALSREDSLTEARMLAWQHTQRSRGLHG